MVVKSLLKKCLRCGIYTLKDKCPKCMGPTSPAHPPKFSPEDKYLKLRSKTAYEELLKKSGQAELDETT